MYLLPAIGLAFVVFEISAVWRVFAKAGQPGWAALIPFYNVYVLLKIAERPGWWLLLWFIPGVNIVIILLTQMRVARAFGKSETFGVFLAFLWWIFMPILGYGAAKYGGATASASPPPPIPAAPRSIEQRLAQLETANHRLRGQFGLALSVAIVAVVVVAVLATMQLTPPPPTVAPHSDEVRTHLATQQLEILDADGTVVARLSGLKRRDQSGLAISNAADRAVAFVSTDSPRLEIFDDANQTAVHLSATSVALAANGIPVAELTRDEQGGQLQLRNAAGGDAASLSGNGEGGHLFVSNRSGQRIAEVGELEPSHGGLLRLFDGVAPDKEVLALAAFPHSGSVRVGTGDAILGRFYGDAEGGHLALLDFNNHYAVDAHSSRDGGFVTLASNEGKPIVVAGARSDGGELSIFNRSGARGLLALTSEQGSLLNLNNAAGKSRVAVSAAPNGGDVAVYNQDATRVGNLGTTRPNGHGDLAIYNAAGQRVTRATVSASGGELIVRNNAGKDLAALGATSDGNGDFLLYDSNGKKFAWLGMLKPVAGLSTQGGLQIFDTRVTEPTFHSP